MIDECVTLTNQYRAKHGRKPLKWSDSLGKAAQYYAEEMARTGRFTHGNWARRIQRFIRRSDVRIAENIAFGQENAAEVVRQWIESPGHKRNILDRKMRKIGVGFARDGEREYWVQDFGAF